MQQGFLVIKESDVLVPKCVLVILMVSLVVLVVVVVVVASHYYYKENHHQDHQNHPQDHQNTLPGPKSGNFNSWKAANFNNRRLGLMVSMR
jgi:flagellar basal body-associated protein FliL